MTDQDTAYQSGNEEVNHAEAAPPQETEATQDNPVAAEIESFRSMLGLPEVETEQEDDQGEDTDAADDDLDEAEEAPEEPERDAKGRYIKVNKEQVFVPEDEYDTYLQKGANYEKVKGRLEEAQQHLDRVAKMQGFKDHAELVANLDTIEQTRAKQEQDQFDQLTQHLRESALEAGIEPEVLDQWLENHPAIKQAKEVAQYRETEQQRQAEEKLAQEQTRAWNELFTKYPGLAEQVDAETGEAPWITPEMKAKLARNYDPIDAYELAHRGNLAQESQKKERQRMLKEQRLQGRSKVDTTTSRSATPFVNPEVASAFAMFGLPTEAAQKYVKKG